MPYLAAPLEEVVLEYYVNIVVKTLFNIPKHWYPLCQSTLTRIALPQ